MLLTAGTRLGPYQILAPLGAGGMGEVYRASDTKLGREVAIKVLPEAFARDPERLARFEREARLLAALNHPNIAAIYGFEQADGVPFLVLELVPVPPWPNFWPPGRWRFRRPFASAVRSRKRWRPRTRKRSFTAT